MAAATGSDIPATSPRDTFTGVAARSVPVTRAHPLPLPTPPNSISPALPPHGLTAQLHRAGGKLDPVDSDLDLQDPDAGHRYTRPDRRRLSTLSGRTDSGSDAHSGVAALVAAAKAVRDRSPPYESADSITPAMLAKYHLPEILLNHGPLAIRYIVGHLTASVPGFSFIPPAKSRRLVVAALEGRGSGGEGGLGGLEGDVEFEKVSWGVWNARRVGGGRPKLSTPLHASSSLGIPITSGSGGDSASRLRQHSKGTTPSRGDGREDVSMLDEEVDNMSMDGEGDDGTASASCSEAPDDDVTMNDDPENLTDDEDWGAMGAAALRAGSYSNNATAGRFSSSIFSAQPYPSFTNFAAHHANSSGSINSINSKNQAFYNAGVDGAARSQRMSVALNGPGAIPDASEEQERDAVEALLRLGSV